MPWGRLLVMRPNCLWNSGHCAPIYVFISHAPCPTDFIVYKEIHFTTETRLCLSCTYHKVVQFQRNLDEVQCQTKIKKITFALIVHKCAQHFHENHATHQVLNARNHSGVSYDLNIQALPPEQRMTRHDQMTKLTCCPSWQSLPFVSCVLLCKQFFREPHTKMIMQSLWHWLSLFYIIVNTLSKTCFRIFSSFIAA